MVDRNNCREAAYTFVIQKLLESGYTSRNADSDIIFSLADLYFLKNGQADPSDELITSLRSLLKPVVSEAEFDAYLVQPFRKNSERNSK